MIHNVIYNMSSKELSRRDIIIRVDRKELTQLTAAAMLNIGDRRVREILAEYRKYGDIAFVSKKRGKPSNRALPEEFRNKAISLVKQNYYDFGPTFAAEKLAENHNIKVHNTTLRCWMIEDNIFRTKRRKPTKIHQSRERRDCVGELIQIDGSHHAWFEGRADKCCLLVFIDDATSALMYCRFEKSETSQGYFRATKDYINTYGKPLEFYSDRAGIFKVNHKCAEPNKTQFQRAMGQLNIKLTYAYSPQAKGRVERANKTLQDRLIKEMRLRGINNIDDANKYLPEFISKYNEKFAKLPKDETNIHRQVDLTTEQLEDILSIRTTLKLSKNLEFSFNNKIYQITDKIKGYRLRKAVVTILENTDNQTKILYKNIKCAFRVLNKNLKTNGTDNKNITKKINYKRAKQLKKYHLPIVNIPIVSLLKRNSLNN